MLDMKPKDRSRLGSKRWRMENLYKIRDEKRKLVCLRFNRIQEKLWRYAKKNRHRGLKAIQDKARKMGVSTWWLIYYLDDTLFTPNTTTAIIAHTRDDVKKLFKIVKLAYATCPNSITLEGGMVWVKPIANYDNVNELTFSKQSSSIYVGLENRGDTINNLHISEAAHIKNPEKRLIATLGAVPNNGLSNITIESTANGVGDWFHDNFTDGEAGIGAYDPLFFAWWEDARKAIEPPKDYKPTKEAQEKAALVKVRYNFILTPAQLYWWDSQKRKFKKLMDQEYPTVSEDSFMASGNMVFDTEAVSRIKTREGREFPMRIETRDMNGKTIYKTFTARIFIEPKPGHTYVLGGDPAEGLNQDNSVAEMYDELTFQQAAELVSGDISPAEFAQAVDKLCRYYNNALAVIERNNHGGTVLDRLRDIYGNIFIMVHLDEQTNKKTRKLGWQTNSKTRDLVLDKFEELVAEYSVEINSAILKSEMLTFVTDETGKREAKTGKHDDTIIASAIALQVARMPKASFEVTKLN